MIIEQAPMSGTELGIREILEEGNRAEGFQPGLLS